ncbi:DNA repair exonuclease SbcCD nuclease subunit [Evansella vedderi]|uniref:DNA repair exonuclease SbcCD nuclease subunit n=1 Tax=Evansella vedderi TaxID=38282 RepID=A0ABT9ZSJ5_9BACI|nr:DNA repair exonuclease [Evansella vedderi]MDQ0254206.1 DNA repair exonuclease SbcCD nuclease subunit [Evansella vedderi]
MIRFIHAADLHLGRAIRTRGDLPEHMKETIQQATYTSFERIVDQALEWNVDFVLISGDVYDHEERSLRGQWFVRKQAKRLEVKGIPLFIIHGNHDPLNSNVVRQNIPANVHIFSQDVEGVPITTKGKDKVYIYGFSYPQKAYYENPIPKYERKNDPDSYHIAMLHGQEAGNKEHEPYAPFTLKEVQEKDFHYWALGHIHKRQTLSPNPPVVYPGNIQGAHRNETGEKGAYLVEMTKVETTMTFLPTNPVQWEKITVSIEGLETYDELLEQLEEELSLKEENKLFLLDLTIHGSGPLHDILLEDSKQDELLTILREEVLETAGWVDRIHVQTIPVIDRNQLRKQDHLLGDVVRIVDDFKEKHPEVNVLEQVYGHASLRKYLTPLTEKDVKEIVDEAEMRLLTPLLRELERQ